MGVEPTSSAWKADVLADVLHPHMVTHTGVEPVYPADLRREVQIAFQLPTRYVTDRAAMPHNKQIGGEWGN